MIEFKYNIGDVLVIKTTADRPQPTTFRVLGRTADEDRTGVTISYYGRQTTPSGAVCGGSTIQEDELCPPHPPEIVEALAELEKAIKCALSAGAEAAADTTAPANEPKESE